MNHLHDVRQIIIRDAMGLGDWSEKQATGSRRHNGPGEPGGVCVTPFGGVFRGSLKSFPGNMTDRLHCPVVGANFQAAPIRPCGVATPAGSCRRFRDLKVSVTLTCDLLICDSSVRRRGKRIHSPTDQEVVIIFSQGLLSLREASHEDDASGVAMPHLAENRSLRKAWEPAGLPSWKTSSWMPL
jgi:hypothetical protein